MTYIFGPVPSRRLGLSLGIDPLPAKKCTLNCIYCQVGETTLPSAIPERFVEPDIILKELEELLKEDIKIDYITFSGAGEPTLYSALGELISELKKYYDYPIAVITNGTLLYREEIRQRLLLADLIMPSLDSVDEITFQQINRPVAGLTHKLLLEGLIALREEFHQKYYLEIMFLKDINTSDDYLQLFKEQIKLIKPDKIHLNTIVRPPSSKKALPMDLSQLQEIAKQFGSNCEIIAKFHSEAGNQSNKKLRERILTLLQRRPVTRENISEAYGISLSDIDYTLKLLMQEQLIASFSHRESVYYRLIIS